MDQLGVACQRFCAVRGADRERWADRPEFSGSFQPELLTVWLIRQFTVDLAQHLAPGGKAVLSGLLVRDAPMIITAHRLQGLRLIQKRVIRGWLTLVFEKPRESI